MWRKSRQNWHWLELVGGLSYKGFELSRVNCISLNINQCDYWPVNNCFGKSMTNQRTLLKCNYLLFVVSQLYSKGCKKHDNPTFLKGSKKSFQMHVHRLLKLQFVPLEHCVVWTCFGASVNADVACMIWIRISDPRSLGSWNWHYKINQWIRLICHDPSDLNHWTWSGLSQWNVPLENSSSFNSGGFELMPSRLQNSICYITWFI